MKVYKCFLATLLMMTLTISAQEVKFEEYDLSNGMHVILHKDFNTERAYRMVGHHGTYDDREIEVPLMRIGI